MSRSLILATVVAVCAAAPPGLPDTLFLNATVIETFSNAILDTTDNYEDPNLTGKCAEKPWPEKMLDVPAPIGKGCFPKCHNWGQDCPKPTMPGVSAEPHCVIDARWDYWCALICDNGNNTQCGTDPKATCKKVDLGTVYPDKGVCSYDP